MPPAPHPIARLLPLAFLAALALLLAACGGDSEPAADAPATTNAADGLQIVATTSIIGDLVEAVGGDTVELTTLVGPDQDPHTFEPTPSDSEAIASADLVIENGLGLEEFLDDLIDAANEDVTRWNLSLEVPVLMSEGDAHGDEDEHGEEEKHNEEGEGADEADAAHSEDDDDHAEAGGADPHVWQSAKNAQILLDSVESALSNANPGEVELYKERAAAYRAELDALDAEVRDLVEEIPEDKRLLVTSHDTFGHFARDYGFEVVGVALPSTAGEAGGSSAGELAELITDIKDTGTPAIFAENIASSDLMQTIADEAGVSLGGELYTDALGPEGSPGETYLGMLRHNATTIQAALTGP